MVLGDFAVSAALPAFTHTTVRLHPGAVVRVRLRNEIVHGALIGDPADEPDEPATPPTGPVGTDGSAS